MARAMTATRQALPLAVAVLALAGCGRSGDRADARAVAESFYAAVNGHEGARACTWLSPDDCVAAFLAAMTAPGVRYATMYGVSRNTRRWWDLAAGQALGFEPHDDAERYAAELESGIPADPSAVQGGAYAAPEYTVDRQR